VGGGIIDGRLEIKNVKKFASRSVAISDSLTPLALRSQFVTLNDSPATPSDGLFTNPGTRQRISKFEDVTICDIPMIPILLFEVSIWHLKTRSIDTSFIRNAEDDLSHNEPLLMFRLPSPL